jgi:hypothetical protein
MHHAPARTPLQAANKTSASVSKAATSASSSVKQGAKDAKAAVNKALSTKGDDDDRLLKQVALSIPIVAVAVCVGGESLLARQARGAGRVPARVVVGQWRMHVHGACARSGAPCTHGAAESHAARANNTPARAPVRRPPAGAAAAAAALQCGCTRRSPGRRAAAPSPLAPSDDAVMWGGLTRMNA